MGQNRRPRKTGMIVLGILILSGCFYVLFQNRKENLFHIVREDIRPDLFIEETLQKEILKTYMPSMICLIGQDADGETAADYLWKLVVQSVPVLAYTEDTRDYETQIEDANAYEAIRQSEGADEEAEEAGEPPVLITPQQEMLEHMNEENQESSQQESREPSVSYSEEELQDFSYLLGHFYTVDKATGIDETRLSAQKMLEKDMHLNFQEKDESPQILIYHTHSQEGYADSILQDEMTTVVGVGARLAELLEEKGYHVLHHRGQYDRENRDYAYANAAPALEQLLKENPEIEIIIDIHRDGVAESRHLVTEVDGKQMAQFMFFNGLSKTTKLGDIEYLPNPYIEDNLAFAFQLQLKSAEYYPGLARKIYLKGYRYNMHYRPRSLLVEVGAQTNTLEEALNTMEPLSDIIDMVLSEE